MRRIVLGDFTDPRIVDLVKLHLSSARANSGGPGSFHAFDITELQAANISFWAMWDDDALLGCGALKEITADHGEVKSMHTAVAVRGQGVGTAILQHIIAVAHDRGMSRLSLETGAWDYFLPAQALYRRHGFVVCPPFEGYTDDPNSVFMSLNLRAT